MTAAADSPLISAGELADALAGPVPPTLIDIRWHLGGPPGIESYRAGHIPGAVYVDLDTQLAGPPGPDGRHPLPAAADFQAAMVAAGVRADSDVVVYDDADATVAARAWWLLRYFGHGLARGGHGRVRVLDGGLQAWRAAGLPVSTADESNCAGRFHRRAWSPAGAGRGRCGRGGQGRHPARRPGAGQVPR